MLQQNFNDMFYFIGSLHRIFVCPFLYVAVFLFLFTLFVSIVCLLWFFFAVPILVCTTNTNIFNIVDLDFSLRALTSLNPSTDDTAVTAKCMFLFDVSYFISIFTDVSYSREFSIFIGRNAFTSPNSPSFFFWYT